MGEEEQHRRLTRAIQTTKWPGLKERLAHDMSTEIMDVVTKLRFREAQEYKDAFELLIASIEFVSPIPEWFNEIESRAFSKTAKIAEELSMSLPHALNTAKFVVSVQTQFAESRGWMSRNDWWSALTKLNRGSLERLLSDNIKLAVNVWILLHINRNEREFDFDGTFGIKFMEDMIISFNDSDGILFDSVAFLPCSIACRLYIASMSGTIEDLKQIPWFLNWNCDSDMVMSLALLVSRWYWKYMDIVEGWKEGMESNENYPQHKTIMVLARHLKQISLSGLSSDQIVGLCLSHPQWRPFGDDFKDRVGWYKEYTKSRVIGCFRGSMNVTNQVLEFLWSVDSFVH